MTTSRRDLMKSFGAGAAALAAAGHTATVLAQGNPVPPAEVDPAAVRPGENPGPRAGSDPASNAERDLKIVTSDLLEDEARKLIPARRFAFMGPAGDGVTYRENRRAFNDYPIMPRRLQGISA